MRFQSQAEHARQQGLREWSQAWPRGAPGVAQALEVLTRSTDGGSGGAGGGAGGRVGFSPWMAEARGGASVDEAQVCLGALALVLEGLVAHPDQEQRRTIRLGQPR